MSSSKQDSANAPNADTVSEIDALIKEIQALHERRERAIAKHIKRSRKGRVQLAEIESLGIAIPEELRALYWNWNGAEGGARMSFWDKALFFDYFWQPAEFLVDAVAIARAEKQTHADVGLRVFFGWQRQGLMMLPNLSAANLDVDDSSPLVATEPWAEKVYFAFDGIIPMLKSVLAAEKAGAISYAQERITSSDGSILAEPNEIRYDAARLWDAIAPCNPRVASETNNYWLALAEDKLEFDGTPPDISDGNINLDPEVKDIVFKK